MAHIEQSVMMTHIEQNLMMANRVHPQLNTYDGIHNTKYNDRVLCHYGIHDRIF